MAVIVSFRLLYQAYLYSLADTQQTYNRQQGQLGGSNLKANQGPVQLLQWEEDQHLTNNTVCIAQKDKYACQSIQARAGCKDRLMEQIRYIQAVAGFSQLAAMEADRRQGASKVENYSRGPWQEGLRNSTLYVTLVALQYKCILASRQKIRLSTREIPLSVRSSDRITQSK